MTALRLSRQQREVSVSVEVLDELLLLVSAAAQGDFEPRFVDPERAGPLAPMASRINELLDVTSTFMHQTSASMGVLAAGGMPQGNGGGNLPGKFLQATDAVNKATARMGRNALELKALRSRQLELANAFETSVGQVTEEVSLAAERLRLAANALAKTADGGRSLTALGRNSIAQVSAKVEDVRERTSTLVTELSQIDNGVMKAQQTLGSTRDHLRRADEATSGMAAEAKEISVVVRAMAHISAQTRLLAINAAIEAAKAGPVGRGFGVVASEVKKLAGEAARASDDIESRAQAIGRATLDVVTTTRALTEGVGAVSAAFDDINNSVELQREATREIALGMADSAAGAGAANASIRGIDDGARETAESSGALLAAAEGLQASAGNLASEVKNFLSSVREGQASF